MEKVRTQRAPDSSVGRHTPGNMRHAFWDKAALQQFPGGPGELVRFNRLRLHPFRKAIQTFLKRQQGREPEPRLNQGEVRNCVANVAQPVLI